MKPITYHHVDVFSSKPFSGNGLIVFTEADAISRELMQLLTQEMRQFESIFLQNFSGNDTVAKIFTCQEEVDFAGHPVLGAAAVLHDLHASKMETAQWNLKLNAKTVSVSTQKKDRIYEAWMNQGQAEFSTILNREQSKEIMESMNLATTDLYPGHAPIVVSTGLPYLLLPLNKNAFQAKIKIPDLEERMKPFGAKFIGVLDIPNLSIRTWDNDGIVEDVATGSLVGPCGAYLVKYGFQKPNKMIAFKQGHNLGRPSQLFVRVTENNGVLTEVYVGGSICKVAKGFLETL